MVKSSRTRHSKKTKTRRHRKSHTRRRRSTRKTRGGTRCFDARGNPDSEGLYNIDGSRNSNCPN